MKELQTNQLKQIELEILIYVDSFCRKNKINYSLCGGTLLGAIRHKGFIPWDDDIDINMTRDQYVKFIELFQAEKSRYKIITYQNNKNYNYLNAKIVDTETILIEEHNNAVEDMGVYIDIFPVDTIGQTKKEAINLLRSVKYSRFLCEASNWKHYYINRNRSVLRQVPRLLFYLASHLIDKKNVLKKIDDKFEYDKDKLFWGSICGVYEENEVMDKSVFSEFINLEFEGHMFCAMKNYDVYLTNLYGNYMLLPPQKKQVSHHTFKAYWKNI